MATYAILPGRAFRRPADAVDIDWDSPQAAGLVGLWTAQHGAVVDLTGRNPPTRTDVVGAPTLGGMAISLAGGTYVDCGTGCDVGAELTVSAWVYGTNFDPAWCYICGKESNSPPYGGWVLRETNGQFQFNFATTDEGSVTGGSSAIGVWTHVAATYRTGLGTLYVNGVSVGTPDTSKTGDLRAVATTQFRIGESSSFTGRYWIGKIAQVYVSRHWRSNGEIWQMYDPATRWELLRQPSRRIIFDVGAAPAFKAAWARGSNTILQPGLR